MSYVVEAVAGCGEEDFEAAVAQARAHFEEMPGLTLTLAEAARLWAIHPSLCRDVLTTLVEMRFLTRVREGVFARA